MQTIYRCYCRTAKIDKISKALYFAKNCSKSIKKLHLHADFTHFNDV